MKIKELTIRGVTLSVAQWKKRREQLARGFALGAFTKEKHVAHWQEWEEIQTKLREISEY